jgi:hypothetical protein
MHGVTTRALLHANPWSKINAMALNGQHSRTTPYALQSASLRRRAILRYATLPLLPDFAGWFGYLR